MESSNMANSRDGHLYVRNQEVEGGNIPLIEWNGVRVVTTETLTTGYRTTVENVRRNLNRNRSRFIEGIHIFTVEGEGLASLRGTNSPAQISNKVRSITLYTERGAARMSKIVDTDEAWSFFEKMENSYFSIGKPVSMALAVPDFSDPASAARAWADEYEARQRAISITHQQAEYITRLEGLFTEGLSPVQFCKRLNGVNTSKVNAYLVTANWLYDDNPNGHSAHWRVKSYARDRYLTEKTSTVSPSESEKFTAYKPVLLRKGAVWLYQSYLLGKLPMKRSWSGELTNDKVLVEVKDAEAK